MEHTGQSDMFGPLLPKRKRERGWTELDRIRARFKRIEERVLSGEYKQDDLETLRRLSSMIVTREEEAKSKWAKSFGR